jgi:deoxyhypusine synthase
MTHSPSSEQLRPCILEDSDRLTHGGESIPRLEFRRIEEPGEWLEAAYAVLHARVDQNVLDPCARYAEWLNMSREGRHPFPCVLVAAFLREGQRAYILGVVSGNIMRTEAYVTPRPEGAPAEEFFALRHQVTVPLLERRGVKGAETRLWEAAVEACRAEIRRRGGSFAYSLLEAEGDSLGFWTKRGYRWPQGVRYWQPPLEFDADGSCVRPEVPEVLLVKPMSRESATTIDRDVLLNMIATVYLNWSLDKHRKVLSAAAMERAETYVMKSLFGRVAGKMPPRQSIDLLSVGAPDGETTGRKHFRSVALHQGTHHALEPLRARRPSEITDFDDMLQAMKDMAFGARTLGEAADVLYAMAVDPACKVVLTLSGALTIAKQDFLIAELIERGLIHCIVTTGAVVCHGFNAERGGTHFKMREGYTDLWLFEQGYNRIYDTIETEYALDELEEIIHGILGKLPKGKAFASYDLTALLGEYAATRGETQGIIGAAHTMHVPVFIPAFTDSEIGLDVALYNHYRRRDGLPEVVFNPFRDFEKYCEFVRGAETRGIITLGGGVPRNWSQQVGPYMDAIERKESGVSTKAIPFKYAVRICPDPPHWGGLSGSTYSEGVSWGKFLPREEGGRHAEVLEDFTVVFPLLVKGLLQRLDKTR